MALDYQHWMVTVALVTSSLIAFIANLLLLLVFCKRRGLRTISNRFTINLLLTNLLSSVLLIPLLIVEQQSSPTNQTTTILQLENSTFTDDFILEDAKHELLQSNIYESAEKIIKSQLTNNSLNENETEFKFSVFHREALRQERLSVVLCYLAQSTVSLVCTASILSVLLIGIDQYFAVIHSLRYYTYIDKFRSTGLIVTSWLISVLFAIFGALTQSESHLWQFCVRNETSTTNSVDFKSVRSIYAIIYFIFIILTPFLAICIIYVCIYAAAHNNSERMRKSTKGNTHANVDHYMQILNDKRAPSESRLNWKASDEDKEKKSDGQKGLIKVQSAPNFSSLVKLELESAPSEEALHAPVKRTSSDRVGFITNLKSKISNASVFKYREETRAAKISLLVIFMVLICYLPYGLAVILNSHIVTIVIPANYNFISLVLLMFSNIISPFLFVYRNRRIRRELLKFLRLVPPKNSHTWSTKRSNSILPQALQQQHKKIEEESEKIDLGNQPFISNGRSIPQVIITCKVESEKVEKHSILKRVCSGKNWQNYKKCTFITVPESCWQTDSARGSFSSASTQSSLEE